jgi:hypothetical protein
MGISTSAACAKDPYARAKADLAGMYQIDVAANGRDFKA